MNHLKRHTTNEKSKCENHTATKSPAAKAARRCEHVKTNGEFCGSPALRGRNYCYFHLTYIARRMRVGAIREIAQRDGYYVGDFLPLDLPLLEDANAIQMALSQIIDSVVHHGIDLKRAGLVLYALQTASQNLARGVDFGKVSEQTAAGGYDEFEDDFALDEDLPELKASDETGEADNALTPHAKQQADSGGTSHRDIRSQWMEVLPSMNWRPKDRKALREKIRKQALERAMAA